PPTHHSPLTTHHSPRAYYSSMNPTHSGSTSLTLSGDNLTIVDAEAILRGRITTLALAPSARKRVERSRRCLEELVAQGATLYGVNTGFGKFSNQRIGPEDVIVLQENLLRSHAVGMGTLLPVNVGRLMLALRIQALAKGYSGVTVDLLDMLIELF